MTAAAIFENRKITISQQRFDRSSRNLARWCILAGWLISSLQAVENLTFQKSSMVHGRCLNNRKSRYVGKGLANRENLILMQPRLIGAAAKITNPNRQPTLTILLQNQNLFGVYCLGFGRLFSLSQYCHQWQQWYPIAWFTFTDDKG